MSVGGNVAGVDGAGNRVVVQDPARLQPRRKRIRPDVLDEVQDGRVVDRDTSCRSAPASCRASPRAANCRPSPSPYRDSEVQLPPVVRSARIRRPDEERLAPVAGAHACSPRKPAHFESCCSCSRRRFERMFRCVIGRRGDIQNLAHRGGIAATGVVVLLQTVIAAGRRGVAARGRIESPRATGICVEVLDHRPTTVAGRGRDIGRIVGRSERRRLQGGRARGRIVAEGRKDAVRIVRSAGPRGRLAQQTGIAHRTRVVQNNRDIARTVRRRRHGLYVHARKVEHPGKRQLRADRRRNRGPDHAPVFRRRAGKLPLEAKIGRHVHVAADIDYHLAALNRCRQHRVSGRGLQGRGSGIRIVIVV